MGFRVMNYATLEEAYGTPFGGRKTVEETTSRDATPPAKPAFTSLAKRGEQSREKNQGLVDSLMNSLPLARESTPPVQRQQVRESFTGGSQPAGVYEAGKPTPHDEADKVSRILRLVEQNRTGYERPAMQDIGLYVFTGVFFLFTFDTFVEIGKALGRQRT